ncbi:mechanosensitive ion channel family protein [Halodesulfovibrio marinisediminis]|uniref:Mechanosensitive ion channel n=1 Tax=Halodesulfovibrio marinisediminis DSM 17456 TaxID=1121457 RepID=A0A1N6H6L7_9BACT|nr:mechanosensitive ion channel domain-containing protein [Halodesulfovibrio marinisediminis]SIO15409.1 Mechanosensitive ion channel [Halodesulfovibrio marinisediminis DSM 17456]
MIKEILLYLQELPVATFLTALLGVLTILWAKDKIDKTESQRQQRISSLSHFQAKTTDSPVDRPNRRARKKALESIESRFSIIRRISLFALIIIWVLALIFPYIGSIPATYISVFAASVGVVVGIMARPLIENTIAGMVISFSQPFRVNDTVIVDGHYGTIEDITTIHTVLKLWNWKRVIFPNSLMLSQKIINYTKTDLYQWVYIEFMVSYDCDLDRIERLVKREVVNCNHFADYEDPRFWVIGMEERSFKCWVVAWANNPPAAWELGHEVRSKIIKTFRKNNIHASKVEFSLSQDNEGQPLVKGE